jgi:hypothetical protein
MVIKSMKGRCERFRDRIIDGYDSTTKKILERKGEQQLEEIADHYGYKLQIVSPKLLNIDGKEIDSSVVKIQGVGKIISLTPNTYGDLWYVIGWARIRKIRDIVQYLTIVMGVVYWMENLLKMNSLLTPTLLAFMIDFGLLGFLYLLQDFITDILGLYLARRWLKKIVLSPFFSSPSDLLRTWVRKRSEPFEFGANAPLKLK